MLQYAKITIMKTIKLERAVTIFDAKHHRDSKESSANIEKIIHPGITKYKSALLARIFSLWSSSYSYSLYSTYISLKD
jgi:hypothetical protein